jgi:hypothetical protein
VKKFISSVSVFFLLAFTVGITWCEEFYVSTATELQSALTKAQINGEDDIIKVAQGLYKGNFSYESSEGHSISLLGGYTSNFSERIINPENTVLDGGNSGTVLYFCDISNLSSVVGENIRIEGFTIRNGYTTDEGGGICVKCGRVYSVIRYITIADNIISDNTANGSGGGVNAISSSFGSSSSYTFINNVITNNTSKSGMGGGIYAASNAIMGSSGHITLENNIIAENTSYGGAGGAYAKTYVNEHGFCGNIIFIHNNIIGNRTSNGRGGGVDVYSWCRYQAAGQIIFSNNNILDNQSGDSGGGVNVISRSTDSSGSRVIFKNNSILRNVSTWPESFGGGICTLQHIVPCLCIREVIITNNTISRNNAANGGGLALSMHATVNLVYNNIIWENEAATGRDIYFFDDILEYCIPQDFKYYIREGFNNNYSDMYGDWTNSGGNMDEDPSFSANGDFHLLPDSPCIDEGLNSAPELPSIDLEGNPRLIDGDYDGLADVDMGAYEHRQLPIFHSHDYNGDGRSDIAVWRPSDGTWHIKGWGFRPYGKAGDDPVLGDFNGNSCTNIAVWRPSNGIWYIKNFKAFTYGFVGDIPVPGDYDGDRITDIAVWRPSNGIWYIRGIRAYTYGTQGDIPVPGDYDGDGMTDIAVWRPSNGTWYIRRIKAWTFGRAGDIPVPADYNGDGLTDMAVWRPSDGIWRICGKGEFSFGRMGDIPVPGDYDGDGRADIAVWRPANGTWYIKGLGEVAFGQAGDTPLVR